MSVSLFLLGRDMPCAAPSTTPSRSTVCIETATQSMKALECHSLVFVCLGSLAIASGRWNRRRRSGLPIEEQLWVCGAVQTERLVVEFKKHVGIKIVKTLASNLLTSIDLC
ncbi:hypothetical protein E2C01_082061 [Portunus trituberculatus]|uniref:Uncharacterized protein n=1 Tax=Portunus trituberculatus TaxID=210409 RepID=A0A5B7IXF6_PORTR|nr:hypothetical protein [Portunus trituberculatus]